MNAYENRTLIKSTKYLHNFFHWVSNESKKIFCRPTRDRVNSEYERKGRKKYSKIKGKNYSWKDKNTNKNKRWKYLKKEGEKYSRSI